MNAWFAAAGFGSAVAALIHVFAGGRYIAQPLLEARDIRTIPRLTNYYCWHMVTIVIAAMAAAFIVAALAVEAREAAIASTALAAAFAVWNAILILWREGSFVLMPQWALFAPIAVLGVVGLS